MWLIYQGIWLWRRYDWNAVLRCSTDINRIESPRGTSDYLYPSITPRCIFYGGSKRHIFIRRITSGRGNLRWNLCTDRKNKLLRACPEELLGTYLPLGECAEFFVLSGYKLNGIKARILINLSQTFGSYQCCNCQSQISYKQVNNFVEKKLCSPPCQTTKALNAKRPTNISGWNQQVFILKPE